MTTKEILRVNHIPSPFFKTEPLTKASKTDNAKIEFFAGIGYNFTSTDKANAQINLLLPVIDAGYWVFSCDLASGASEDFGVRLTADDFSAEYAKHEGVGDASYHAVTLHFRYDAKRRVMLQIRTTGFVNLRNGLQLELASTFDAAVAGGGASVLRLGHHAARLNAIIGRVVPDDVRQEPEPEPERDQTRRNLEPQRGECHREAERRRVVDLHVLIIQIGRRPVQWFRSVLDSRIVVCLRDALRSGRWGVLAEFVQHVRPEGRDAGRCLACAHDSHRGHVRAVLASAVHLREPRHHTPARFVHGIGLAGPATAGTRLVRRRFHAESLTAPVRGWSR